MENNHQEPSFNAGYFVLFIGPTTIVVAAFVVFVIRTLLGLN